MSSRKKKATTTGLEITGAILRDEFCIHSYKIKQGADMGFVHNVKGTNIVHEDLRKAFDRFNVHFAVIDDVFKNAAIEIEYIAAVKNHAFVGNYAVHAFKITGDEDDRSIQLKGTKYLSAGGRVEFETPKIPLDNLSSYQWYNELKEITDAACVEVYEYIHGKCTPSAEPEEDSKQMKITDTIDQALEDAKL